jgi:anti-sigma-K factor RskA
MTDQPSSNTSDMNDLLGAFALDAVDADERGRVEQHLAVDPVARAEVDEMRETAAVLASLPRDDEGAPDGLWERIAGAIGEPEAAAPAPAPIPITRAKRVAAVPARVFVPLVAAAAIVIALLTIQLTTRAPNSAGNVAAAYRHAVSSGATTANLEVSGSHTVAAQIALQDDGTGYLRNQALAPLPSGQTYQLWAIVKNGAAVSAISAGVLGRDPGAVAFHVASRPNSFAVTVERVPGVVISHENPVAVTSGTSL